MMDAQNNNKDSCLLFDLFYLRGFPSRTASRHAGKGMVSGIVCEVSRSNLGMLVEPLY